MYRISAAALPAILAGGLATAAEARELCPGLRVEDGSDISLTETEKILVCGTGSRGSAPWDEAWRRIPLSQARFHLRAFLQERGYYSARLEEKPGVGRVLEPGPVARVSRIVAEGTPPGLEVARKRLVVGEVMTPGRLSELESWLVERTRALGYPCPVVQVRGDFSSGVVTAHVIPGDHLPVLGVAEDAIEGLRPGMLRRYDAFRFEDPFNGDWLRVTNRRVLAKGIVQSYRLGQQCQSNGVLLKQETIAGQPRILTFGFGVDTEGLVSVKASWKNARLGPQGSQLNLSAFASSREQRLDGTFAWYFLEEPSRKYVGPGVEFSHQNEKFYEALSNRLAFRFGTTWDGPSTGLEAQVGPAYESVSTLRGEGPKSSQFLSLEGVLRWTSHEFELYQSDPRTGFNARFTTSLASRELASDLEVQRYSLVFETLGNVREYDPPLWVLGVRGGGAVTATSAPLTGDSPLPSTYRHYLGGSADLRGFGRQELPGPSGGLSLAFVGFEVRWGGPIPLGLQPFGFLDLGVVGTEPWNFSGPLYWSPGLGVRWASPVGTLRSTFAHGYVTGAPGSVNSHFQFFLSLGEEF